MAVNYYSLIFASSRTSGTTRAALLRTCGALNEAVRACEQAYKKAQKYENDVLLDAVEEDESDVVEAIIGIAFVLAQTEIEATVKMAQRLHERATTDGRVLASTKSERWEILKVDSPPVVTNYTRVEVINAFANYFKHRDGWDWPWSRLKKKQEKETAIVIIAAGADENSNTNLRTALHALGIKPTDLKALLNEMFSWKKAIRDRYRAELHSLSLL
jgi:hypothetical protein